MQNCWGNRNRNPNQSTDDEVKNLSNDELNEVLNRSPTTPESVDDKGLEILIMATIATWTRKDKQCGLKEVLKVVKGSLKKEKTSMNILVNWFQIKWKMLKSAEIVIAMMTHVWKEDLKEQ